MYEAGLLSMGALAVVLLAFAFLAYLARGHRIDLTNVRAINVWEDLNRRKAFGPWRTIEKEDPRMPEPDGAYDGARAAGLSHDDATRVASMQHGAKTREVDDE